MPSSLGIVASGEDVLNDAVLWLDASLSTVSGGKLTNLGKGGSALDAQFGSTTSTDTNDPLLLTHSGTNYLYLPGTAGNYASSPDSAAVSVTGNIEIVLRVALDDWTPTTSQCLIAKRETVNGLSFQLALLGGVATSEIAFSFNNGTTDFFGNGTVTPPAPFADGTALWLKFTRVAATGAIAMSSAPDQATEPTTFPTSWTPSGTRTAGNIKDTLSGLEIGSDRIGAADFAAGKFYRAIIRNGIGGTTVFDADFTTGITSGAQTTFTESSANAATVTINRAATGRKSVAVTRNVLLLGTDDYLEVADNDLLDFGASESFTLVACVRGHGNYATALPTFIGKAPAAGLAAAKGWSLRANVTTNTLRGDIGDGATRVTTTGALNLNTSSTRRLVAVVYSRALATAQNYTGSATDGASGSIATVGDAANALPVRIGSPSDSVANGSDFEFFAAAVFRRALTVNELATIAARYP